MTEDEMVRRHHRFDGHESEQALGDGGGQKSLACCSPWGLKRLEMSEQLNNNNAGEEETLQPPLWLPPFSQKSISPRNLLTTSN